MPLTLADYARYCSDPVPSPRPSIGRWQRLLCRLGVHRWHRAYHQWRANGIIARFMSDIPELADMPWKKMDGNTYTYKSEAD